jgi:WD40-like Beta Propeller Repeat
MIQPGLAPASPTRTQTAVARKSTWPIPMAAAPKISAPSIRATANRVGPPTASAWRLPTSLAPAGQPFAGCSPTAASGRRWATPMRSRAMSMPRRPPGRRWPVRGFCRRQWPDSDCRLGQGGFGLTTLTTDGPNAHPAWSPDGQWIAFESWRDGTKHDIYRMTFTGGQVTRLTNDSALDYQPAWRP